MPGVKMGYGNWGMMALRVSFWGDENVLKLMPVMVAQIYEYIQKSEFNI